jgi:U2 small nuclear ribonucleoprotein B''
VVSVNLLTATNIESVYIRNINEKVSLNALKSTLNGLFKPFGPVLSITAHKNLKMRGQAFVALESEEQATRAVEALQGRMVFQKKIECQLAKSSSNSSVETHLVNQEYDKYLQKRKDFKEEQDKTKTVVPKITKVNLDDTPPNKILLIQNLPGDIQIEDLTEVFGKYKGYVEVRLVAIKKVAFVEFKKDDDAIPAKEENMDLTIRETKATVNYAKK